MWKTLGQNHAIALFERALKADSMSQVYLITGSENIGKNTLALDFAMALNCMDSNPPCGQCNSCQRIMRSLHADIIYISTRVSLVKNEADYKGSMEIGIDDMRRMQQLIPLPPYEGKYKIFIIDGADLLSNEGANCILKTLEELLPHVMVMLLAADEKKVLPTIVSRCQRIHLEPLTPAAIENHLVNALALEGTKARYIAKLSAGRLGFAVSAACDESVLHHHSQMVDDMIHLLTSDLGERFSYIVQLDMRYRNIDLRKNAESMLSIWLSLWRDFLLVKCNCTSDIMNTMELQRIEDCSALLELGEIKSFVSDMQRSLLLISKNANIRLTMEVLMLHMPLITVSGTRQGAD
ncbi:MAG TPA: hypothetical protein VJ488_01450 [Dehalococcoidia bacterium]|nr:hypothetical protein [Dehalococcoidia bacterium]